MGTFQTPERLLEGSVKDGGARLATVQSATVSQSQVVFHLLQGLPFQQDQPRRSAPRRGSWMVGFNVGVGPSNLNHFRQRLVNYFPVSLDEENLASRMIGGINTHRRVKLFSSYLSGALHCFLRPISAIA